ncbi:MAG TPA: type II CAAX endopeptidase family protein [Anaerolineales bacterium]|nr:type II CAAX endopeptidase family protein [Anaerolineales bacterium]
MSLHGFLVLALTVPASIAAAVVLLILQVVAPGIEGLTLGVGALASAGVFILATYAARRLLDRRSFVSLGFTIDRHTLPDVIVGFLIPFAMLGFVFALAWAFGWIQWQGWAWEEQPAGSIVVGLATGLALFVLVAISEETLSRGYHLQNLAESLGLPAGWILSSLIFASMHALNPGFGLPAWLGLIFAGLFLATGWLRTRRLWLSIGLHVGWNFFEGSFFGFPVSGLQIFQLMNHRLSGPAWATGGPFGPEAGAIVLPGLLLGTALVWIYTRGRTEAPGTNLPLSG